MFNPTTQELWTELDEAVKQTQNHTDALDDLVRNFTGRHYDKSAKATDAKPENWEYSFVSNILPSLGYKNPTVNVDSTRIAGFKIISQAMQDGLNAWIEEQNYSDVLERVFIDYLFCRGVLLHYLDIQHRSNRGSVTPCVKRIAPDRFFIDSQSDDTQTDEFRGHIFWEDVDNLLADDRLTPEIRGSIKGMSEGPKTAWTSNRDIISRNRVKCYCIWMRGRNTLRFLTESNRNMELYPERPYFGPKTGPYTLFDAYPVADSPWPLSPMVAVRDQCNDLNIHAMTMQQSAGRRRTIAMVEAANKDLGDKLARAKDGEIIPVKGISGQHVMFEFPGATKEQYQFVEYLRSRLDRSSGMTATVQGDVAASNTATEAQIASDAMSNRVKFIKNKAADGMRDSLSRIAWYLFHTEGIVIPVNRRDTTTGQMIEGVFFGGPMPTDQGATYDDFAIEVQVGDDNTETTKVKVMGFYQVFFQVMQAAPLMPWVRWTEVVRDLADAWDMSTHSDDWFIPEFLGGYTQPQLFPVSQLTGGGQDLTAQDQATPLVNYNPTLNPNNPGAQLSGNPGMLPPGRPQSQGSSQAAPGTNMKPVVAGRMASNGQTSGPRPQMQR